jgi:hypothetical protein
MEHQQGETTAETPQPPVQDRVEAVVREIAAIRERFAEDWHRSPQALAAASALWQGGHNEHGVFSGAERETVARSGRVEAAVSVARSPAGLFACGAHFSSPYYGFGHLPSVWGRPFVSREEARRAAVEELLAGLEQAAASGPPGQRSREDYRRVREQLLGQLRPRQRGLFE